ncbi:MAG: glycosyltransferase [Chitinophagaceae bacterium]|nr:glycosyltransferase [Chitinophagaceae bacterium]
MAKPRLLIVLNRLSVGGPASNTLALAHALCNEFDILLIAGKPVHGEESAEYLLQQYTGFKVQILPSIKHAVLPFDDYHAYHQIKKIVKEFKPQIIHTHGSKPGVLARVAAWRCKVPVIVHTYHGHVFHSYFHSFVSGIIVRIERWLAKHSTFIVAINERLKNELTEVYKIAPAQKIILNRLGIEAQKFSDAAGNKRRQFRNQFQINDDVFAIGIIGRLVPVKQHSLFIHLAEQLLQLNPATKSLKFFIVGDGDEKPKLKLLLQQKRIAYTETGAHFSSNEPLIFTSWQKEMDVALAGLDLVVLTSLNEGTPVSIMEAMSAGKPVVASNVGGIAELFQDNANGLLFNTPVEMVEKMQNLINTPSLLSSLSSNAASFARAHLSLENQVFELKSAYLQHLFRS